MADGPVLLRCEQVRKTFPGVVALDDVSLEVQAGSIHAIVGENGAGKSTLMKVLSGAVRPDSGRILVDGRPAEISGARAAQRLGIAIVYQEFTLANDLSAGENIFLGRWPRSRVPGLVNFAKLEAQTAALLSALGIVLPPQRAVRALTVAQQQMVEIAKALSLQARILILDEPSAVLTPHELEALFRLVRDLKRRGVAVIYISHRLEEIFELADVVSVFRDGRRISTSPVDCIGRGELIEQMVGRPLTDEFPLRRLNLGKPVLQVEKLASAGRFRDLSFDVAAGEVFGLTRLVGSGRSSVIKALFGAIAARGRVRVGENRGPFKNPRQAIAAGVACLPEDRRREGLLMERSLRENTTLANLGAYVSNGLLSPAREKSATRRLMGHLSIKAGGTEAKVATLSGGNQQKVLLARWMDLPHQVVLFDEPTRGVDVGAKYEIYTLVNRLASSGAAVVMVSSELPEIIGMADRIGVMCGGRLAGILDNRDRRVGQTAIMSLAAGQGSVHD